MTNSKEYICACCGKQIKPLEKIIVVGYKIVRGKNIYEDKGNDYFHEDCDKAFRSKQ